MQGTERVTASAYSAQCTLEQAFRRMRLTLSMHPSSGAGEQDYRDLRSSVAEKANHHRDPPNCLGGARERERERDSSVSLRVWGGGGGSSSRTGGSRRPAAPSERRRCAGEAEPELSRPLNLLVATRVIHRSQRSFHNRSQNLLITLSLPVSTPTLKRFGET